MDDTLTNLRTLARKLAKADEARARLLRQRDDAIRQAFADGATWKAVEAASGLTPRGVALAVKRV
jgi:hypothetical protein